MLLTVGAPDGGEERDRSGERVLVRDGSTDRVPVPVRVAVRVGLTERVPVLVFVDVGDGSAVRVAVAVREAVRVAVSVGSNSVVPANARPSIIIWIIGSGGSVFAGATGPCEPRMFAKKPGEKLVRSSSASSFICTGVGLTICVYAVKTSR